MGAGLSQQCLESGAPEARSKIINTPAAVTRYHCAKGMSEMAKGTADRVVPAPKALLSGGGGGGKLARANTKTSLVVTVGKATVVEKL